MQLGQLFHGMPNVEFQGDPETEIRGLAYDSRQVRPGYLFVALRGRSHDGHDFIDQAVENGAVAVAVELSHEGPLARRLTIRVTDTRETLSKLAVRFYDSPFKALNMVGITGTNGKTTTTYILESILVAAGAKPGVIGTINYRFPGHACKGPVITPESLDLMQTLRKMADAGVTDALLEVSSHALDQGRARDCPFRVAVFTNISRDHLDYHPSMEAYFSAKSRLFIGLRQRGPADVARAVINVDDPKGKVLTKLTDAPVLTYGLEKGRDVRADNVRVTRAGLMARLITHGGEIDIRSRLLGDVNIYNILAAAGAALCLNLDLNSIASGIERLNGVPGRLERVENARSLDMVVDYAHTPDALLKALQAVSALARGRVITVFGCGGDRDKGKRRQMGMVAGTHSDVVFITSDNPRTEDPAAIAFEIEQGVRESGLTALTDSMENGSSKSGYVLEIDRSRAIQRAINMANSDDFIIIAGKGHEDYQIIGKEKHHLDDREIAVAAASGAI